MTSRILTVPNQITFLRLGFLPLFIISILYDRYSWALVILIAAGLTDGLDGLLARRLDQRSALGAYLDPIADKLLLSSSFFILALKGKIQWWLTVLVLGRDVSILTAAVVILLVAGYRPFPPSIFGKVNTAAQILLVFVVVCAVLVNQPLLELLRGVLVYLVAVFTVLSGFHYSVVIARQVSSS